MVQWLTTALLALVGIVAVIFLTPPQYLWFTLGAATFGVTLGVSVLLAFVNIPRALNGADPQ